MEVAKNQNLAVHLYKVLASDARTKDAVIEVIEDRGIVTLQGQVASPAARTAAEELVTREPGVTSVINELVLG